MAKYDDYGHGDADGNYNDKQGRDRDSGGRAGSGATQDTSQSNPAPVEERVAGGGTQAGFMDRFRFNLNEMNPIARGALDMLMPGGSMLGAALQSLAPGGASFGGQGPNPDRDMGSDRRGGNALANALMANPNSATPNQQQSQQQNSQLYYTYPDGSRVPMNGDPFSPTSAYDTANNGYGNGNIDWFRALMGNAGNGQINW